MAGDWIKMRVDLATDPAVISVAAATGLDEYAVVGRLHHLWSWADKHTKNGVATGVTMEWLDRFVCAQNFSKALVAAGWLTHSEKGISLPRFERHMSQSAKHRALATEKKRRQRSRSCTDSVPTKGGQKGGLEKRREEKRKEETAAPAGAGIAKAFIAWFCDDWKTRTGTAYVVTGRDAGAAKWLTGRFKDDELKRMVSAMWADPWGSQNASISLVQNQVNKWQVSEPPKRHSPGPDLSAYRSDDDDAL